jgi:hypothetical protein
MAWVQKETIDKVRAALKVLNKEYGMKTSVSGTNSSSLKVRIVSGKIDFVQNRLDMLEADHRFSEAEKENHRLYLTKFNSGIQVNHYWLDTSFSGVALEYLEKVKAIMSVDHWDKSDVQSDYFHCAYYMNIDIGKWDKPYEVTN